MNNWNPTLRIALIVSLCVLVTALLVIRQPGYFTNVEYLGGLVLLEAMVAAVWKYQQRFFPLLILAFLLAGTNVPMGGVWGAVRWLVLGTGAVAGAAIYLANYSFYTQFIHWVAISCVVAAATSAEVSSFPKQPLLKAFSLLLLFLYGTFGARLAVKGREEKFSKGLLLACEALIWFGAIEYFILRRAFFGNPNSLGAIMGVVAVPLMLWGVSVSETKQVEVRRMCALLLSMSLLLTSYARASIVAAAVSGTLFCVLSRRYRMLIKGALIVLVMATVVVSVVPLPSSPAAAPTLRSRFLFKGKERSGVLGSRTSVWDNAISSIEHHPWFGTGFGTALSPYETNVDQVGYFASNTVTTREHGNSYLTILQGVGLIGVIPFLCLLLITIVNIGRALNYLWLTRDRFSIAVPMALVLVAGLVHAMFEDWLFAVGYYVCVVFWSFAFMLLEVVPGKAQELPEDDLLPLQVWHEDALVSSSR
ncbi:MAG: O-antigen ligase family protein [Terriglobales bacterium]